MKFAGDAKVASIMDTQENLNFVQQLMTSNKTTLRPSFEVLCEKHFQSLGNEQKRIGCSSHLHMIV